MFFLPLLTLSIFYSSSCISRKLYKLASSKICSKAPPPPAPPHSPAPPSPPWSLAPALTQDLAHAAPAPPPTSCQVFIMTDIDRNFTTSVVNASHDCSSIWSVDLLFFEYRLHQGYSPFIVLLITFSCLETLQRTNSFFLDG